MVPVEFQNCESIRIGEWLVEPSLNRLSRDAAAVTVEPMAMAVLAYLADHRPSVVSSDELIQEVWHGRPLGDNPVYKCVEKLRKALGDKKRKPAYIETIPRKGYRLIAPVSPAGDVPADASPYASPRAAPKRLWGLAVIAVLAAGWLFWSQFESGPDHRIRPAANPSIAVLPFADMSPDGDQAYFADGIAEEILNLLTRIQSLKVIGRTSSFAFKGRGVGIREVGRILNVTHVLEGSVRKSGDQVRVSVQLVTTNDGSHLWSHSYNRKLENIFAIQSEIAQAIATALEINLAGPGQEPPVARGSASLPAYDLYLQARRLIQSRTPGGLTTARGLLDQALALDPDYPPALAAAGQAILHLSDHGYSYGSIPLAQVEMEALPLIKSALARDPELAEAHAALGFLFFLTRDFERADVALERALELNPSLPDALNWRALHLNTTGRLKEELVVRRWLAEIDPLYLPNPANLAYSLMLSGRPYEADEWASRIVRDFPNRGIGYSRHASVLFSAGHLADALPLARQALALEPDSTYYQSALAQILFTLGDFAAALQLQSAHVDGQALFALGRGKEAVVAARKRYSEIPGETYIVFDLLRTLALSGRHDEVLALYETGWGSLTALENQLGYDFYSSELALIAAAQIATGRRDDATATLTRWKTRLDFMREQGYRWPGLTIVEANYQTLNGDRERALATLAEAIGQGYRSPILELEPAFAALREDPAFQILVQRNLDLINAERARIGMSALP